jgi:threonine/homoserine/homoserine lactone efflux protein
MDIVVGFALGVAVVAPIGPISLLLMAIGLERGRADGMRAGLGVAGADLALLVLVLGASSRLTVLDEMWQRRIELVLAGGMLVFGLHALVSRGGFAAVVERIRRPGRALLLATLGNPMTVVVWLGLVVTLGSEFGTGWALIRIGLGLALATCVWHVGLGAAAGELGSHLTPRARVLLQRTSGVAMMGLAAMLAL